MNKLHAIAGSLCLLVATSLVSRAEPVVIREVMYHPPEGLYEYIEIENLTATPFDIASWRLSGGVDFDFPPYSDANRSTVFLRAFSRMIVCETDPETFRTAYPDVPAGTLVLGPWTGRLENGGERLTLRDKNGALRCTLRYDDRHPWPVAPDGSGHSLVLADDTRFIDDHRLWTTSANRFGSPGLAEPAATTAPTDGLAINEVHFDENGAIDWVELHNSSPNEASTAGLFLARKRDFTDKMALGALVTGRGFASFDTAFPTTGSESLLFLIDTNEQVLDAVAFERKAGRDHAAAYPDGSGDFYSSETGSRDGANDPTRHSEIVITELMVEPMTGQRDGEYVELFNNGDTAVDLTNWRFDKGIDFRFPIGTTLAPGEYLAVAANPEFTSSAHPDARILGPYDGVLANGGEHLRLIDDWENTADEVHYSTGGDWPHLAMGQGSSLELLHPDMDNSKPSSWADSDESQKSTFARYSITDRYDQLRTRGAESSWKELHMHGVGDAHIAFRDMRLTLNGANTNVLPGAGRAVSTNGTGAQGWLCQGTHYKSYAENGEFHLVSTGHGDVKANRCEIDITSIQRSQTLRFTFEARWISGKPTVAVHSWDRSFGDTVRLPVPTNLGTPGATNSAALAEPAPTVSGLIHSPAVPNSTQNVTVTARVDSTTPLTAVNLRHRADSTNPATPWNSTPMADDGTAGDEIAGDGIYTATLTQYRIDNRIVQFYVEATSAGGTTVQPRVAPEAPAMYVVDNPSFALTDPRLLKQRFVISARSLQALSTSTGQSRTFNYAFPRLSNQYFPATFIANEKTVIYNCELRKAGSPFQRDDPANFNQAKWKTPGDYRFRGYSKRSIDDDPTLNRGYHNRIVRYWLYLLGHASNDNEFAYVIINGGSPILREDAEVNANDFLKRNWEDGQRGELYRIDDIWWFDDGWGRDRADTSWAYKNTDEPERYQSEWMRRSMETEYDYSSFINWVKSVGTNRFTREEIERMADIDLMTANAVVRGWVDDWDTLTRNRGKNGYFLRRHDDGKWMLIQWDSDLTFGNSSAPFLGNLGGIRNFFDKPYVRQRYNYYLGEMVDKHTVGSRRLITWLQYEEAASSAYTSDRNKFNNWNTNRVSRARSEIGSSYPGIFRVTSGDGNSLTTSADTVDLRGNSPYSAFTIRVVDHPEADCHFIDQDDFQMRGVQLREGANNLTLEALDREGNVVASDTFVVNKTGNALPVIEVDADPDSWNIAVQNILDLDASESFDPEGTNLTFSWNLTGPQGALLTNPTPDTAMVSFETPGTYLINITATDEDGQESTTQRQAIVFSDTGWSPFTDNILEGAWTAERIDLRAHYAMSSWYSLNDKPGKLTMKILDDAPKSLSMSTPRHPVLWRPVPDTGDFALHTDLELVSVQQGDFTAGLMLEAEENGSAVRYAFAMEDGDFLRVKRSIGSNYSTVANMSWTEADAVIRIRRIGSELHFDYRLEPGIWKNLHIGSLPPDTTFGNGGIYMSSDSPQSARVEFDYAMVVDPNAPVTPALAALRITELMYHPVQDNLEYIEFTNTGDTDLDLTGIHFDDGSPFPAYNFVGGTLPARQTAVLVLDTAAFQQHYGAGITILGQWPTGSLSNGGETIILRDALGNVIHDFQYDDEDPWPTEADGEGPSLEVIDTEGNYNLHSNWRASSAAGGTPGVPTATGEDRDGDGISDSDELLIGTDPDNPDSDGDGLPDGAEIVAGTDPLDGRSSLRITTLNRAPSGDVSVSWTSAANRSYALQVSTTGEDGSWTTVQGGIASAGPTTDFVDTTAGGEPTLLYRVVVEE